MGALHAHALGKLADLPMAEYQLLLQISALEVLTRLAQTECEQILFHQGFGGRRDRYQFALDILEPDLLLATLPGIVRRTAPSAYLEALLDPAFTTRNAATEAADVFVASTPGDARFVVPVLGMLFLGMFAMQMSRRDLV